MSRESDVNLLQHNLYTPVAYPDDGNVSLLHTGADSGAAVLTDGGASLRACCGIDANRCAVLSSLNGQHAAVVLNEDKRCIIIFYRINLSTYTDNFTKSAPGLRLFVCLQRFVRHIQRSVFRVGVVKSVKNCLWYIYCIAIDIGKFPAVLERTVTNAYYAVGDGYGGKAETIFVFVYNFISAFYVLNGRKVKT